MRRAPAPPGRERRDPHGGARPVRLVRELRPAVLHRRRDRAAVEPPGRDRGHLSRHVRRRRPHGLRGRGDRREREDGAAQGPEDRRGDHRALRQARALARGGSHPPAPAGHRPSRDLRGEDGPGRRADPRVDRRAPRQVGRHGLLHGVPDAPQGPARGRRRRRLHRHRDGREPRRPRLRGHAAAARRPDHGAARHRDGALRGASSEQARRADPAEQLRRPGSGRRPTGRSRSSPHPARRIRRTS